MKAGKHTLAQDTRRPDWPDAVKILSRRKLLARNYQCLVGELRSHRRAAAVYTSNPSPSALALVGVRRRRLDDVLGQYIQTLAELRGAVEGIFPAKNSGPGNRRPQKRSRQ